MQSANRPYSLQTKQLASVHQCTRRKK